MTREREIRQYTKALNNPSTPLQSHLAPTSMTSRRLKRDACDTFVWVSSGLCVNFSKGLSDKHRRRHCGPVPVFLGTCNRSPLSMTPSYPSSAGGCLSQREGCIIAGKRLIYQQGSSSVECCHPRTMASRFSINLSRGIKGSLHYVSTV